MRELPCINGGVERSLVLHLLMYYVGDMLEREIVLGFRPPQKKKKKGNIGCVGLMVAKKLAA